MECFRAETAKQGAKHMQLQKQPWLFGAYFIGPVCIALWSVVIHSSPKLERVRSCEYLNIHLAHVEV